MAVALLFAPVTSGQQVAVKVELVASTTTPYVGQVVEVALRVTGRPAGQVEVVVAWLTETPGRWVWQVPLATWIERHKSSQAGALSLRWQGKVLAMPEVAAGVYEWRWGIVIQDVVQDEELPVRLAGVQVGTVRSAPLVLEVRRPPVVAGGAGVWNLGVGSYTVVAQWQKPRAVLGQETALTITVAGKGDLAHLPAPNLATQAGWNGFLLERLPDRPREAGGPRVFRYAVRPRRLGTLTPPPLLVRWFDPEAETVQTRQVPIPSLEVGSAEEAAANVTPGRALFIEDARAALPPDLIRQLERDEQLRTLFDYPWWFGVVLWLPVGCVIAVVVRAGLQRYRPAWWERMRRRRAARVAAGQFRRAGEALTPERTRAILAGWLAVRVDSPCRPEMEALQTGLRRVRLESRMQPLLSALQAWEFGPRHPGQREEVGALAGELFGRLGEEA